MSIKSYKQYIDRCEVVSFDVFDTLIKRNVRTPKDVFSLVEREALKRFGVSMEGFRDKRVCAERTARELSDREEISFGEIYDQLPYEEEIKSSLSQLELEMEYALTTVNLEIKEVYKYAIDRGKEVIIVSDMYLDRAFIERLLLKCGYNQYKKIYVSSETGVQKYTGNMYRMILRENSYSPGKIVHIGDALMADYIRPKLSGIRSVHIPREVNHTLYCRKSKTGELDSDSLYSFINNTVSESGDRLFRIGYETLGPLLYGFCVWLHEYKLRLGIDKFLFLSRDGQIMRAAYKILYPKEDTEYVYASRRSLLVPILHHCKDIKAMLDRLSIYRYTSVRTMLDLLGLDYKEYVLALGRYGLDLDDSFLKKDFLENKDLSSFLKELLPDIIENSEEEFLSLQYYIDRLNLSGKVGIIDIGWRGRLQKALEEMLPELGKNMEIMGFYLGIMLDKENAFGYLYGSEDSEEKVMVRSFEGLLEMLFSADHGSVKRYKSDQTIELYDFEYDGNSKLRNDFKDLLKIREGALCFVKRFCENSLSDVIRWDKTMAFDAICRLGTETRQSDLNRFGNWSFYANNTISPLAKPNRGVYFSFLKLKKGISSSPWKIGYLKRFLKIPLPYLRIYKWFMHDQ